MYKTACDVKTGLCTLDTEYTAVVFKPCRVTVTMASPLFFYTCYLKFIEEKMQIKPMLHRQSLLGYKAPGKTFIERAKHIQMANLSCCATSTCELETEKIQHNMLIK